ncbi:MAG TPA: Ku protein [Rhabdochlamydiaceae bacterium]|nr:Ku protein [Rhabdochlamydiaceae bacterium]
MKAIWRGWLSFGLINIPVNLYSGVKEKELKFHLLHEKDRSTVRYARICKKEDKEVPWEEIVKGYELENGDIIILADEDFEKAASEQTKRIEIQDFTALEEIDPIYFAKPYILEPQKGAAKAYALLREALKESGKVGVAKFVLRNQEHLGVIKPYKEFMILDQLRFAHEIRDYKVLNIPKEEKGSKKELEMAIKLIDQLSTTFDPKSYKDTYREEMIKVIKAKAKGKRIKAPKKAHTKATKSEDFVKVLQASLRAS